MDDAVKTARANAVKQTTVSQGWPIIVETAHLVAKAKEAEAMDCQDDAQVVRLQRKAQAAREFLRDWMNAVDKLQNPDLDAAADSFITIATEDEN